MPVCVYLTQHLFSACMAKGQSLICIKMFTWNLSVSQGIVQGEVPECLTLGVCSSNEAIYFQLSQ